MRRAQADRVGDVAGAGLEAAGRRLVDGLLEGDVGDHVAAALPGRHRRRAPPACRRHADAGRARTPCGRRRRRSRSRAPARRPACARPTARRRPARARRGDGPCATISLRRRDGAERVRDLRERRRACVRGPSSFSYSSSMHLAVVVDRRDAQPGALLGAELLPGHDVGVMLEPGDDDLVALARCCGGPRSGRPG